MSRVNALIAEKGKCPETIAEVPEIVYMGVVKLNNGDVLLYSPVKVQNKEIRIYQYLLFLYIIHNFHRFSSYWKWTTNKLFL